jgi:hypothetical protein
MPVFTIETTYRLPVFRLRSIIADTLDEACRLAIADEDWWDQKHDYDSSGQVYVSGAWPGEDAAYYERALPVPSQFDEAIQRKVDHFGALLDLLKARAAPCDAAAQGGDRQGHRDTEWHGRSRMTGRTGPPPVRP